MTQVAARQLPVRVTDKRSGGCHVGIEQRARASGPHACKRFGRRSNDQIATEHKVGVAHGDAGVADLFATWRDDRVGKDRTAFLREACHVQYRP